MTRVNTSAKFKVHCFSVGPHFLKSTALPFKSKQKFQKRRRKMTFTCKLQTAVLVLGAHLFGAAWGNDAKVISSREYFYVGGEYTNITVST